MNSYSQRKYLIQKVLREWKVYHSYRTTVNIFVHFFSDIFHGCCIYRKYDDTIFWNLFVNLIIYPSTCSCNKDNSDDPDCEYK